MTNEERLDKMEQKLEEVEDKQDLILQELSRYKGLFGGVMLTISAVVVAIKLFWEYIKIKA